MDVFICGIIVGVVIASVIAMIVMSKRENLSSPPVSVEAEQPAAAGLPEIPSSVATHSASSVSAGSTYVLKVVADTKDAEVAIKRLSKTVASARKKASAKKAPAKKSARKRS